MAQQLINVGAVANDRTGDTWRDAFVKVNANETELFAFKDSIDTISVSQESEFPVQDATTITLEANTDTKVTGTFTTAKSFTVKNGAVLRAATSLGHRLTYSGTGSMFNITDASFLIRTISVDHPNAKGINFVETVGGQFSFTSNEVFHVSGTQYGSFTNPFSVLINQGGGTNMGQGITVSGTNIPIFGINRMFFSSISSGFKSVDFGTATLLSPEIKDMGTFAPPGAFGISGLAASGNIPVGFRAMVVGCEFAGGMTDLENISPNDVRWNFEDNNPTRDSRNEADMFLTGGSETITTGSAGDWQEIGVPSVATWSGDIASRFTLGTDGVLTYIGERSIDVRMSGRATVEKSGGGSDVLEVRIAKNWDGTASDAGLAKSRAQTQNTSPTTVPIGALTSLVTNDDIRVIFSNTTGTSNIIASVSSLEITD